MVTQGGQPGATTREPRHVPRFVEWDSAPSAVARGADHDKSTPVARGSEVGRTGAIAWPGRLTARRPVPAVPTGQSEMVPVRTTLVWKLCTPGLEHTVCGELIGSDPVEPGGKIR